MPRQVRLCLQFVERLCARAMEFSRRDALETWRPLEETVHQLERVNGLLGQLLEPKYRALGASPPLVPKWSNRRGLSASATARPPLADGASGTQSGSGEGGKRITALLQPSGLFVVEGLVVKARAALSAGGASALEERSAASDTTEPANAPPEVVSSASEGHLAASVSVAQLPTAEEAKCVAARAVVKTLADVVGGVCEAREEALLKDCMPGAHKYVAELEAYRSMIVGGGALRAVAPTSPHGGEARARSEQVKSDGSSAEIDDDLWRLFGAMETRLYSSPAALGRKPGRIYLTCTTLWFHSKVMSFESRHVLPLSEVKSVTLLGTALDISSSLVIATKSGGEIMLVFPGQRATTLEPVELLIRELVQFIEAQEAAK